MFGELIWGGCRCLMRKFSLMVLAFVGMGLETLWLRLSKKTPQTLPESCSKAQLGSRRQWRLCSLPWQLRKKVPQVPSVLLIPPRRASVVAAHPSTSRRQSESIEIEATADPRTSLQVEGATTADPHTSLRSESIEIEAATDLHTSLPMESVEIEATTDPRTSRLMGIEIGAVADPRTSLPGERIVDPLVIPRRKSLEGLPWSPRLSQRLEVTSPPRMYLQPASLAATTNPRLHLAHPRRQPSARRRHPCTQHPNISDLSPIPCRTCGKGRFVSPPASTGTMKPRCAGCAIKLQSAEPCR